MDDPAIHPREVWAVDFDGHRRAQVLRVLGMSPAERLAWLEDAMEFAQAVGALPRREE